MSVGGGQLKTTPKTEQNNKLMSQYLTALLLSFFVTVFLHGTWWVKNLAVIHTCLEVVSVLISISIFMIFWKTYRFNLTVSQIFGLGFLCVAIFHILHIFYYPVLHMCPADYTDLSTRFGILARFGEAILTFALTKKFFYHRISRWWGLILVSVAALTLSYFTIYCHWLMPPLLNGESVTLPKIILEFVVIIIFIASLRNLSKGGNDGGIITYEYVCIAIMLGITSELSSTLFQSFDSFYNAFAHILRIACYIYFYKGVIVSTIKFPFEVLERTNEHITSILNKLPAALTVYDSEGSLSFANSKALEIFDCQLDELFGKNIHEIGEKYVNHVRITEDGYEKIGYTHFPYKNAYRTCLNRKGQLFKLIIDGYKLENGEIMYIFRDAKDQQMLENLQLQTQTILNSVSNQILIWDANAKVLTCNNAFAAVMNMSVDELTGFAWDDFQKKVQFSDPGLHDALRANLENGIMREVSMIIPGGKKREFLLHAAPIFNVEGELIGFIDVFNDITDLKREQEKLIQQEKLALVGQLGAGIVHECKNFLATIKGNSQLLKLASTEERVLKYAERIDNASEEMNRIITDLLALAKPRVPEMKRVALNEVILSMENILRSSSFLDRIQVEFVLGTTGIIMCDANQIKQVLLNMCKNAAEAMGETPQPLLRIVTGLDADEHHVYVKVSDNGKGIAEDVLDQLGKPFFTTKDTGTGLGLNISYRIIEENHGRIDINTALNKGTTFTITFPISMTEEDEVE